MGSASRTECLRRTSSQLFLVSLLCLQLSTAAAHTVPVFARQVTSPTTASFASQTPTPLPRPFDTSLGNNFTAPSCPAFFNSFLNNPDFQSCTPFSLLLQTSAAFFTVSRSLVQISQVMDAACGVNYPRCSNLMSSLASQIQQSSNCGQDLQYQNPLVSQAYNGFLAYDALYQAGCLRDTSGAYCYGDAMMNITDPSSSYIYYLPLGVQLPTTAQPSCNECLQNTMSVFAASASNSSKPVSRDYTSAAKTINNFCGGAFTNANVQTSAASTSATNLVTMIMVLLFSYMLFS